MFKSPGCLSFRSLPFRFERWLKARGTDLGPNSRKDCSTERSQAESRRLEDMLTADKITKVAKTTEPRARILVYFRAANRVYCCGVFEVFLPPKCDSEGIPM